MIAQPQSQNQAISTKLTIPKITTFQAILLSYPAILPFIIGPSIIAYLLLYANVNTFNSLSIPSLVGLTIVAALLMGLALCHTTTLTLLAGYYLGTTALPVIILAYCMATIIGYVIFGSAGERLLNYIIVKYPKVSSYIDKDSRPTPIQIVGYRLSPILPFAITNIVLAAQKTNLLKLLLYGTLGMLPRLVICLYIANSAKTFAATKTIATNPTYAIITAILLIISTLFVILGKFKSKNRLQ